MPFISHHEHEHMGPASNKNILFNEAKSPHFPIDLPLSGGGNDEAERENKFPKSIRSVRGGFCAEGKEIYWHRRGVFQCALRTN